MLHGATDPCKSKVLPSGRQRQSASSKGLGPEKFSTISALRACSSAMMSVAFFRPCRRVLGDRDLAQHCSKARRTPCVQRVQSNAVRTSLETHRLFLSQGNQQLINLTATTGQLWAHHFAMLHSGCVQQGFRALVFISAASETYRCHGISSGVMHLVNPALSLDFSFPMRW